MENASKALLIAGAVLIAILIITVLATVLKSTGNVSKQYDQSVSLEQVTTFNSNFTKYTGKYLTIHDVVTICNFAKQNKIHKVTITANEKSEDDIKNDNNKIEIVNIDGKLFKKQPAYFIQIVGYDTEGYISKIKFEEKGKQVF